MTYSIVARDPSTGWLGVAVQTCHPAVGAVVPWARAGVGAVATQAQSRKSHGPVGLQLLAAGNPAQEALAGALASDPEPELRQVGMIDAEGRAAGHTGSRTIEFASHVVGPGYVALANLMTYAGVPEAMASTYECADGLPFPLRLLACLRAAEVEGGDARGHLSAALLIVDGQLRANDWDGVLYDLRVDGELEPVEKLASLTNARIMETMLDGALEVARTGKVEAALALHDEARRYDDDPQMLLWFARDFAEAVGDVEPVVEIVRDAIARGGDHWIDVLRRCELATPMKDEAVGRAFLQLSLQLAC